MDIIAGNDNWGFGWGGPCHPCHTCGEMLKNYTVKKKKSLIYIKIPAAVAQNFAIEIWILMCLYGKILVTTAAGILPQTIDFVIVYLVLYFYNLHQKIKKRC